MSRGHHLRFQLRRTGTLQVGMCVICSSLREREHAFQNYGAPEQDSYLPEVWRALEVVRDRVQSTARSCCVSLPYGLRVLANGSENEQVVTRVSCEEAAWYLHADRCDAADRARGHDA